MLFKWRDREREKEKKHTLCDIDAYRKYSHHLSYVAHRIYLYSRYVTVWRQFSLVKTQEITTQTEKSKNANQNGTIQHTPTQKS